MTIEERENAATACAIMASECAVTSVSQLDLPDVLPGSYSSWRLLALRAFDESNNGMRRGKSESWGEAEAKIRTGEIK